MNDHDLLSLLRELRRDGRTIPEFRLKVHPTSEGDVVQLALVDQDFVEQLELSVAEACSGTENSRLFGEAERLVRRRQALRAP